MVLHRPVETTAEQVSGWLKIRFGRKADSQAWFAALSRQVRKLPASLRRSLTWDRGLEMAILRDLKIKSNN
jgi:IS30 family transposase